MHGVEIVNKGDTKDIKKMRFKTKRKCNRKSTGASNPLNSENYAATPFGYITETLARISNFQGK